MLLRKTFAGSREMRFLGVSVFMSKKHCKIKTAEGGFVTMIPRHSVLAKPTVKGILERFNELGAKIIIS